MNTAKLPLQAIAGILIFAIVGVARADELITPTAYTEATQEIQKHYKSLYEKPPKYLGNSSSWYPEISGQRVHDFLQRLTDFSYQSRDEGNPLWGRIQGSKAEREATQWVASNFSAWSLDDVRVESFPLTSGTWQPTQMALSALANDGSQLLEMTSAATAFPSGQTPPGGLVAPVEYVGLGSEAELLGRDLKGKIALLYVRAFSGVLMHSGLAAAARIAYTTEAAGIILWMDQPGNAQLATQLFTPTGFIDHIPWISVGFQDGYYLRQHIEASSSAPKVRLTVRGELKDGTSQNLMAIVPGTTTENIVVTAHIDGFWGAILDNGTGVAALMELARYYAQQPRTTRKRNLIFLVTGDHELEGAGGSRVFAETHPDIMRNTVLFLQLEHLLAPNTSNSLNLLQQANGSSPLTLFVSNGSDSVIDSFRGVTEDFGLVVANNVQLNTAGDVDGIKTVPSAGFIQTGHYYHNADDVLSLYLPGELAHITKAHVALLDRFDLLSKEEIGQQSQGGVPLYNSPALRSILAPW